MMVIGIEVLRAGSDEQRPREQRRRDIHIVGMEASAVHERKLHSVVDNKTPSRSPAFRNLLGDIDRRGQRDGRLGDLRCEPLANAVRLRRDHDLREPGRARVSLLQRDLHDHVRHRASLSPPPLPARRVHSRGPDKLDDDGAEGRWEAELRLGRCDSDADHRSGKKREAEPSALNGGGAAERDAEVVRAVVDDALPRLRVGRERRLLRAVLPRNVRHRACDRSRVRVGRSGSNERG